MLLTAVSALSLHNAAGGQEVTPAAMADLLRAQDLRETLDKRTCRSLSLCLFLSILLCVFMCCWCSQ